MNFKLIYSRRAGKWMLCENMNSLYFKNNGHNIQIFFKYRLKAVVGLLWRTRVKTHEYVENSDQAAEF